MHDKPICPPAVHDKPLPSTAYTRKELAAKLRQWMEANYGKPTDYKHEPGIRERWYRDAGLIYEFIHDHFPE